MRSNKRSLVVGCKNQFQDSWWNIAHTIIYCCWYLWITASVIVWLSIPRSLYSNGEFRFSDIRFVVLFTDTSEAFHHTSRGPEISFIGVVYSQMACPWVQVCDKIFVMNEMTALHHRCGAVILFLAQTIVQNDEWMTFRAYEIPRKLIWGARLLPPSSPSDTYTVPALLCFVVVSFIPMLPASFRITN